MSKKHHFVPQSILKNFSVRGRRRQIVVFDKQKMATYVSSIADAGCQNYFNTLVVNGRSLCFEGAFQECDDQLPKIVGKLLSRMDFASLAEDEVAQLAHIVAIQMGRTQVARQTFLDMSSLLRESVARICPESSPAIPELSENESRMMALRALQDAGKWAMILLQKNWSLNVAPSGSEFWISDNPVVRVNYLPYGKLGLSSPGITISMPLSANCVLEMMCPSIANKLAKHDAKKSHAMRSRMTHYCSPANVLFFNSQQVLQSLRFLYGPSKNFADARWILTENPDARGPRRLVEDGAVSPSKMHTMPDGCWLVGMGRTTFHMVKLVSWEEADGTLLAQHFEASDEDVAEMLADAPFFDVRLIKDQVARSTLSSATIQLFPGKNRLLEISHASDGIRKAMRRSARRTSASEPSGEAPP